jgi:hypothetical protein
MAVVPLDFHNNKTLFLEREKVFVKDKTCLLLLEHDFFYGNIGPIPRQL